MKTRVASSASSLARSSSYKSYDDLHRVLVSKGVELPSDIDMIVGVPISGLLAATILGLYRNILITDLEGFLEGRVLTHGNRLKRANQGKNAAVKYGKILVLGTSEKAEMPMSAIRAAVEPVAQARGSEVIYAYVFGSKEQTPSIDFCFQECGPNCVFDWDILHESLSTGKSLHSGLLTSLPFDPADRVKSFQQSLKLKPSAYYRSFADMYKTTIAGAKNLPDDYDLIVAIPRSGLLPATILAMYKNLPLTDLQGLFEGRVMANWDAPEQGVPLANQKFKKVLIMEDTIFRGTGLYETKQKVADFFKGNKDIQIDYACVFFNKHYGSINLVDYYFNRCNAPQLNEWSMLHVDGDAWLGNASVSLEGVFCRFPTDEEKSDPAAYEKYLSDAEPYFVPKAVIGHVLADRDEAYRSQTIAWLEKHNFKFYNVKMLPGNADTPARQAFYKSISGFFMAEYSLTEAQKVAKLTNKLVYCLESVSMVFPPNWHRSFKKDGRKYMLKYQFRIFIVETGLQPVLSACKRFVIGLFK